MGNGSYCALDWPEPEETFLGILASQNEVGNSVAVQIIPADVKHFHTALVVKAACKSQRRNGK